MLHSWHQLYNSSDFILLFCHCNVFEVTSKCVSVPFYPVTDQLQFTHKSLLMLKFKLGQFSYKVHKCYLCVYVPCVTFCVLCVRLGFYLRRWRSGKGGGAHFLRVLHSSINPALFLTWSSETGRVRETITCEEKNLERKQKIKVSVNTECFHGYG